MATIKDIATLANVSSATVSRILNEDTTLQVPNKTRQAVIEAAKQLQYTKKKKKKSLFTIGIVQWYSLQQELDDPYYLSIRQGVEDFCKQHNIHAIRTFCSDINYLENIRLVDGLICIGKFSQEIRNLFKEICSNCIFLDMATDNHQESTITLDFKNAMQQILQYIHHDLGHQNITYLGGKEYLEDNSIYPDPRKQHFIEYCTKHKLDYTIHEDSFTSESGYVMMSSIIQSGILPSAIIAASDPIAIGAMRALHEHHISIPEDISIIGFDDINAANFTNPPLTTIYAPALEMGHYGASLVYHLLKDQQVPMKVILPCTLMERESCKSKL